MGGTQMYIMSHENYQERLNPTELFGNDATKLFEACKIVMENWLHPYADCYRANYPNMSEIRKEVGTDNFAAKFKAFMKQWYAQNPDEALKEISSRKEWEENRDKQFRIIYGIAKRHRLYLKWHGNNDVACCGDEWEIYKNNQAIGRICY